MDEVGQHYPTGATSWDQAWGGSVSNWTLSSDLDPFLPSAGPWTPDLTLHLKPNCPDFSEFPILPKCSILLFQQMNSHPEIFLNLFFLFDLIPYQSIEDRQENEFLRQNTRNISEWSFNSHSLSPGSGESGGVACRPWMVGQHKGVLLWGVSLMLVRPELLLSTWQPNADMTWLATSQRAQRGQRLNLTFHFPLSIQW